MLHKLVALTVVLLAAMPVAAQETYTPTAENLRAREWFQDGKFGLFVHWGVKQGVKLFFYHSQLDWHHPDARHRDCVGMELMWRN